MYHPYLSQEGLEFWNVNIKAGNVESQEQRDAKRKPKFRPEEQTQDPFIEEALNPRSKGMPRESPSSGRKIKPRTPSSKKACQRSQSTHI